MIELKIPMISIRMILRNWSSKQCFFIFLAFIVASGVFYCEFIIYYKYLWKCNWPKMDAENASEGVLRALILADPHILGPRTGHWFDKIRR